MTTLDSITVRSSDGRIEAEFVPGANLLCCSLRHDGVEYLDQGEGVEAYAERGKTMGVPLLHPWANRLERFQYRAAGKTVALPEGDSRIPVDPSGLPIHGVLPGLLHWQVDSQPDPERMTALLNWEAAGLFELFPYSHELQVDASVGEGALTIATTLRATGEDAVPVSFGYHPYLTLPGQPRESWTISVAAFRRLLLDQRMIPTGEREPVARRSFVLGDQNLDDGFDALPVPAEFEAASGERAVRLDFLVGYPFAQVYAPLGHEYVCFEPMTAPTNALNSGDGLHVVDSGDEYGAEFRIVVSAA